VEFGLQSKTFEANPEALTILRALMITMILGLASAPITVAAEGQSISQGNAGGNSFYSQGLSFPASPISVSDENLEEALRVYSPLVVECWEEGCRPCELMDPKVDQMAEDFKGRIVFAKLCIDENPETMAKYKVSRTPTLLIFNGSTLVYKHVGNYPVDDLEQVILDALHMS